MKCIHEQALDMIIDAVIKKAADAGIPIERSGIDRFINSLTHDQKCDMIILLRSVGCAAEVAIDAIIKINADHADDGDRESRNIRWH